MRIGYTIYPEAIQKLESSGIAEKIRKKVAKHEIGVQDFISNDDLVEIVNDMQKGGWFDGIPEEQRKSFREGMNSIFKSRDSHPWRVKRKDGTELTEVAELEDLLAMIGGDASVVLRKKDLWKFDKFGFRSLTDLPGCVAAFMSNESNTFLSKEGYRWNTTWSDGTIRETHITGDMHCDLRVLQIDRTPYETFDPLGNMVSYRPELRFDEANVIGYHSTESAFLASVIRWIEQNKIKSETLEDKAKEAIEFAKSLGQTIGNTTEHLFGRDLSYAMREFIVCGYPLETIDEKNLERTPTVHSVATNHDSIYGIYTNKNGELLFVRVPRDEKGKLSLRARFLPSEADHLVKGILYQAAKGLGRTSVAQLIAGMQYRFSSEYDSDMKREF
ncbi:MAG: hypothetical protein Q8P57_03355 [Candidatus Pacearchaeota archaeon]|nr:hypothetical protein [Candidatus Pacearchaeota archaeon]